MTEHLPTNLDNPPPIPGAPILNSIDLSGVSLAAKGGAEPGQQWANHNGGDDIRF